MVEQFKKDALEGLTTQPKSIPSKYFYDDKGSRIFQEIMDLPEYYLTDCEFEIFKTRSGEIFEELHFRDEFNIIELGAGDCTKTLEMLKELTERKINFNFYPIDISQKALDILEENLKEQLPDLKVFPLHGDYFEVLKKFEAQGKPSLYLFLGSNIGNYEYEEALKLFRFVHKHMNQGDFLLTGFDLKKDPQTVLDAYNDSQGTTARFNLNLLDRMNRELNSNFDKDNFEFQPTYDPESGEVRSYIVCTEPQQVSIADQEKIVFEKDETIYTELSKKYSLSEIEGIAAETDFRQVKHFMDKRQFFSDSLWKK